MDKRQRFVWGPVLTADRAALNAYFAALPEQEKAKGRFTLASKPPADDQGLVATLWDARIPGWHGEAFHVQNGARGQGKDHHQISATDCGSRTWRTPPRSR